MKQECAASTNTRDLTENLLTQTTEIIMSQIIYECTHVMYGCLLYLLKMFYIYISTSHNFVIYHQITKDIIYIAHNEMAWHDISTFTHKFFQDNTMNWVIYYTDKKSLTEVEARS